MFPLPSGSVAVGEVAIPEHRNWAAMRPSLAAGDRVTERTFYADHAESSRIARTSSQSCSVASGSAERILAVRTPTMTTPLVAMARSRIGRGPMRWSVVELVGVIMAPFVLHQTGH